MQVGKNEKQEKLVSNILLQYALSLLLGIESVEGLDADAMQRFLESLSSKIAAECKRLFERYDLILTKSEFSPEDRVLLQTKSILDVIIKHEDVSSMEEMRDLATKVVQNFAKAAILEQVEESFKSNFPAGYFDKLKAGKPQGNIQLILDKKFKDKALREHIEMILAKFSTESSEQVSALIHSIASICDKISATEKVGLLLALKDERITKCSNS